MFTLDGKTWYKGDPNCTELEPVTGFTPEECQEMQESIERVMAAQGDNLGYSGRNSHQAALREAFGVTQPKPYPKPKEDQNPDSGVATPQGLIPVSQAIKECFTGELIQEGNPEAADEIRDAFGKPRKKKPETEAQKEIKRAFDWKERNPEDPIPLRDLPTAEKLDESSPNRKELLVAFGGPRGELIVESLGSVRLEEATFLDNGSLEEDWKLIGSLVDSQTPTSKPTYPLEILKKVVAEKLWRNSIIYSSHAARQAKDLTKALGRVVRCWLDGTKLKFEALLSSEKVDQFPGLKEALANKLVNLSMAARGETGKDDRTVVDIHHVSLDLLVDKASGVPASSVSGIETVTQV